MDHGEDSLWICGRVLEGWIIFHLLFETGGLLVFLVIIGVYRVALLLSLFYCFVSEVNHWRGTQTHMSPNPPERW